MDHKKVSMPPIVYKGARILVLGSMPGEKSLTDAQYYAHPQNLFWRVILGDNDNPLETSYQSKLKIMREKKVALWDVLQSCERKGSLDSNISARSEVPNDITALLHKQISIKRICLNGKKAASLFKKHIVKSNEGFYSQFDIIELPSTSPANASIPRHTKIAAWEDALCFSY